MFACTAAAQSDNFVGIQIGVRFALEKFFYYCGGLSGYASNLQLEQLHRSVRV